MSHSLGPRVIPSSRRALRAAVCFLLVCATASPAVAAGRSISSADRALLEDLSRRSFRYFWEQADPNTGLVLDRARTNGSPHDEQHRDVASIAATGFGVTALCVAAERRWIDPKQARERVRATLRFLAERAPQEHGWFYHFVNYVTGEREWKSEISSIDTAILLAGILTARQYFRGDAEIAKLATKIYARVDFRWMQSGHQPLLSHGWKPETGFLESAWDTYSEHTMLYLLAIGSPTHPIAPRAWKAWRRDWISYAGYSYIAGARPLFIHQYSHAWVDYRGRRERSPPYADYFENSVKATRAHRAFCIELSKEFPGYSENLWGITSSDSPKGYVAWGGPPRDPDIDGTVVPCAAGGSLMFAPDICLPVLRTIRDKFGEPDKHIWGVYGFVDAFNPNTGWVDPDVIGIDVGITMLSAENLRNGTIWRWFMRNPEIPHAMRLVGLVRSGSSKLRRAS